MATFKAGDRLRCVNPGLLPFSVGDVVIAKTDAFRVVGGGIGEDYVDVQRPGGGFGIYRAPAWRFVLVPREPEVSSVDTLAETVTPAAEPQTGLSFSEAAVQAVDALTGKVQETLAGAPDDNPKTRFGMAKPPLSLIPGAARVLLAEAFRDGAAKYGPANWRESPVSASTYLNAAERHLVSWQDGEEVAADSGVHHLAHAAACLLILLDAQASGSLKDDRPTPTVTADLIREKTRPLT